MISVVFIAYGHWTETLFWVYLVIIISNGYQYGYQYLIPSTLLTIIGLLSVWYFSVNWLHDLQTSIAVLITIVVASTYLYIALRQLNIAIDREQRANAVKNQFLANMSHDIRTPMNGILGMLDIVLDKNLDNQIHQNLIVAKDSAESLLILLDDILDISKLEAGKLNFENQTFSLHAFFQNASKLFIPTVNKKNIYLKINLDPDCVDLVKGDRFRLQQVFVNIVSNAIKFTDTVGITVRASTKRQNKNILLSCTVTDTGIGMSKDRQQNVFGMFNQAETSTSRHYGGVGLGLAIAKMLVQQMQGNITVISEPSQGSSFHFEVVLEATEELTTDSQEDAKAIQSPNTAIPKDRHILLVEDNLINQTVVKKCWKILVFMLMFSMMEKRL